MTSHTVPAAEPSLAPLRPWHLTAKDEGRGEGLAGDSNRESIDWVNAASQVRVAFLYSTGESNTYADIDKAWASLARTARNRWLRENPF